MVGSVGLRSGGCGCEAARQLRFLYEFILWIQTPLAALHDQAEGRDHADSLWLVWEDKITRGAGSYIRLAPIL